MAYDYLEKILNSNTLEEGKKIINRNFKAVIDNLNDFFDPDTLAELLSSGVIDTAVADKADRPDSQTQPFQEGDVAFLTDGGNLLGSGIQGNTLATLETAGGKLPANQWIDPSATRIYVDTNLGDDLNEGTDIAHPFKTIKAAVESSEPGTTIFVAAGDYHEENPITVPPRVSIIGDELRNVRLFANNPRLDYFHVNSLDYLYGLRFMYLQRPSFAVAFPCAIADATITEEGTVSSIELLYSPDGYAEGEDVDISIDPPLDDEDTQAEATAIVQDGVITSISIDEEGSGYTERPRISIPAPAGDSIATTSQPFIIGSPYIQNCSSITGPFDVNGVRIPETVPLPYDFENGFVYDSPFTPEEDPVTFGPVDEEGAGGGIRIDGRVCYGHNDQTAPPVGIVKSPLRSMVADAFTQVNQGGPGHLITNLGYAQFVSCFTTFCTYGYKANNGGFTNISNSVSDFGNYGLISEGYAREPYTTGTVTETKTSSIASVRIDVPGLGYQSEPNVTISDANSGGGTGADFSANITDGEVTNITVLNPGVNFTSVPELIITPPTFDPENETVTAEATAILATVGTINMFNFDERRPDIGSITKIGDQWVTITNVVDIPDGSYDVSFYPGVTNVAQGQELTFHALSSLSTGSHVFEFVGSGVTYNALPEYGGIPNPAREVQMSEPGKVYYSSTDHIGNFRVGEFFNVEQSTGTVTINTDAFNLSGLNSIGPFSQNGVPFGVAIREATNNDTLIGQGAPEENTVASVFAIKNYISNVKLKDLFDVNAPAPQDKQFLKWNNTVKRWRPGVVSITELNDVDVDTISPENGLTLTYSGGTWIPGNPESAQNLDSGTGKVSSASEVFDHINNTSGNPHNIDTETIGAIPNAEKGQPDGVVPLDGEAKIPSVYLPTLASGSVDVVADIAERDALIPSADEGDIVRVLDADGQGTGITYIFTGTEWTEFGTPESVTSVNNQGGDVFLTTSDISEGQNLYYTNERVDNEIEEKVTEDFINGFYLSAQEVKDDVDPNVSVEAYELFNHVRNIYDENFIPNAGPSLGANPHGITPELIKALPETATTDDIQEGSNLYYTSNRVRSVVDTAYVNLLGVNAASLNNLVSSQFLRSDVDSTFEQTLKGNQLRLGGDPLGTPLISSSANLQVNGLSRMGTIYLHQEQGGQDSFGTQSKTIKNLLGELYWDDNLVWNEENDGEGSGLDADFFDGRDSTDFALLEGANFTGDVNVQGLLTTNNIQVSDDSFIGTETIPEAIQLDSSGNATFSSSVEISGDLTVLGTITKLNTTNTEIQDAIISLNSGQENPPITDPPSLGLIFQRYSDTSNGYNAALAWNESNDEFSLGTTLSSADENTINFENTWLSVDSEGPYKLDNSPVDGSENRFSGVFSDVITKIVELTEQEYEKLRVVEDDVMYVVVNV